jgi:NADH:ubiquinone oxidoreductase subunit E
MTCHRIEICLGSSCFARGSHRYPAVVQEVLGVAADVRGHRCEERCTEGPMVIIDGVRHQVPDEAALRRLLVRP